MINLFMAAAFMYFKELFMNEFRNQKLSNMIRSTHSRKDIFCILFPGFEEKYRFRLETKIIERLFLRISKSFGLVLVWLLLSKIELRCLLVLCLVFGHKIISLKETCNLSANKSNGCLYYCHF